jgi:hypothetical protein
MSYYERTASSTRSHMWFVGEMVRKVRMTPEVASSNLRTYITWKKCDLWKNHEHRCGSLSDFFREKSRKNFLVPQLVPLVTVQEPNLKAPPLSLNIGPGYSLQWWQHREQQDWLCKCYRVKVMAALFV